MSLLLPSLRELTLFRGIKDYLDAAERNRTVRKVFAIDRLVDYFGDTGRLEEISVLGIRKYRNHDLAQRVTNATVNIEVSTLSAIFRVQLHNSALEFNPCSMVSRLPENHRDVYICWDEFQQMVAVAGWLKPVITILYHTGMRLLRDYYPKDATEFGKVISDVDSPVLSGDGFFP
ncbi:MAG: hypothetical protein AB1646_16950 [Thermodesulfobacteriota bacterium]